MQSTENNQVIDSKLKKRVIANRQGAGMLVVNEKDSAQSQNLGYFLPLKELNVQVDIHDSISTIHLTQIFENPSSEAPQEQEADKPIEVTYQFPKEKASVVSKMQVTVGDKTINTKVMEKEKAQEKYDDAIAAGNQATMLKESKDKEEQHQLDIGNVLPGQQAKIEIDIIQPLSSEDGAFNFNLPLSYFPKLINTEDRKDKIVFNFSANIKSPCKQITQISHPENFEVVSISKNEIFIQKVDSDFNEVSNDMNISYRTHDMDEPKLVYQRSADYPGQVAVLAQFLPTFVVEKEKKLFTTTSGLDEQDVSTSIDSNYQFIFVVDRSGSMGCNSRMQITKDAMRLFMQSLPSKCDFGVISFGSNADWMFPSNTLEYNNQSRDESLNKI